MSQVQFSDEQRGSPAYNLPQQKGLILIVQRWGLAKDAAGAQKILLVVIGIAIAISLATFFLGQDRNDPVDIVHSVPILQS